MKGLVFVVLALVLTLAGAADERSILDEHLTAYARLQEHGMQSELFQSQTHKCVFMLFFSSCSLLL